MIRMKKRLLVFLPFFLLVAGVFTSCEEVEEVGRYDNWRERNEAFIDSLSQIVNGRPERIIEGVQYGGENGDSIRLLNIPVGEVFAIKDQLASMNNSSVYVYCKKILPDNPDGKRPLFTGVDSRASVYYYGTNILGDRFDGNFKGYSATDRGALLPTPEYSPTEFDSPTTFAVYGGGLRTGWTTVLQYMRAGERWIVFLSWGSAYGASGSGSILGYSTLAFDMQIQEVL